MASSTDALGCDPVGSCGPVEWSDTPRCTIAGETLGTSSDDLTVADGSGIEAEGMKGA